MNKSPDLIYGQLFKDVQLKRIFDDSKTFADATPKFSPEKILHNYKEYPFYDSDNLMKFVRMHFDFPESIKEEQCSLGSSVDILDYIKLQWEELTRNGGGDDNSSLINLPKSHVVPGGRFKEVYYWDSYFTMLGLAGSGNTLLLSDMVENFAYLIDSIGFVPNGNRTYYTSRSQPPFFSLMVDLLATTLGDEKIYCRYFSAMETEYEFWMAGIDKTMSSKDCTRAIKVDGCIFNRYWDDLDSPRPESYWEDYALGQQVGHPKKLYRHIRAGAESGWDFSSRWFADPYDPSSIETCDIIPIDLNCILCRVEQLLAASAKVACPGRVSHYKSLANARQIVIQNKFFCSDASTFSDLFVSNGMPTGRHSLAMVYPLFFGLATQQQAEKVASYLESHLLMSGGWASSTVRTPHQWDSPNGWAPLQWISFVGLRRYGFKKLADKSARCWLHTVESGYLRTGRIFEKYNVVDVENLATGGEYAVQHGFGWTNAIYLKMKETLG